MAERPPFRPDDSICALVVADALRTVRQQGGRSNFVSYSHRWNRTEGPRFREIDSPQVTVYPCPQGWTRMSGEMLDTTPEAQRFYFERLSKLTTSQRLALMRESSLMIRHLAEASIRREHPNASPEELRARLAVRLYGREVVEHVLGSVPADAR